MCEKPVGGSQGGLYTSIGSSSNVNACRLSLRKVKSLWALLCEVWKEIIEEIYLGHSVRRWAWDWYLAKHVHPRGSLGKNQLQNSPVGACLEMVCMKRLYRTGLPTRRMKYLSLPSHPLGKMTFFFFSSHSALHSAKGRHTICHLLITKDLLSLMCEAIVLLGSGYGPIGVESATLSASSLIDRKSVV